MIIESGNTLISTEIFSTKFICNLERCKGACCVEGDRGAPLEMREIDEIGAELEGIRPYMTPEGIELLNEEGFHEGTEIDDPATTCLPGGECVFAYRENGILGCAIEKAWKNGDIHVQKPVSCHLYPIRISRAGDMDMLNYHQWDICKPGCELGEQEKMPLFRFLKTALERRYGTEWYAELEQIYKDYLQAFPENGSN